MKKKILFPLLLIALIVAMVCLASIGLAAEEGDAGEAVPPCTEHTPGPAANCQDAQICLVCGEELAPVDPTLHKNPGPAASCGTPQKCLACDVVMAEGLDHVWGDEPTCVSPQRCKLCRLANPEAPATGIHTPSREEPTCELAVSCKICLAIIEKKLGHDLGAEATCGSGQQCNRCHKFVENASGDCDLDWSKATVVRAASPDAFGIIRCSCSECGTEVERAVAYQKTSTETYALATGLTNIPADATFHSTVKKVADFGSVQIEKKYQLIQAMELSMVDGDGNAFALAGKVNLTVLANNTVNKLNADCIKVYLVTADGVTEITDFKYTNDNKTLELELDKMGTLLIAAHIKTAKEILGQ